MDEVNKKRPKKWSGNGKERKTQKRKMEIREGEIDEPVDKSRENQNPPLMRAWWRKG